MTEFVALQPERVCTVRQGTDGVTIILAGLGPTGPVPNRVDVMLERCEPPAGVDVDNIELVATTAGGQAGAAWLAVDGQAVSGELNATLTLAVPPGLGGRLRLRVREVERLDAATVRPAGAAELTERVVFAQDVVLAQ